MKFVMQRNRTVASALGHSIEFLKGVPTHVPPALYREVQAAGAVSEEEIPESALAPAVAGPVDVESRKAAMFAAFEKIVLRNVREEFTAGGAPHNAVLAVELGWTPQGTERDIAWAEFRAGASD